MPDLRGNTAAIRIGSFWSAARPAYLSVDAVNAGANGIAGIVGRHGYYGGPLPEHRSHRFW